MINVENKKLIRDILIASGMILAIIFGMIGGFLLLKSIDWSFLIPPYFFAI